MNGTLNMMDDGTEKRFNRKLVNRIGESEHFCVVYTFVACSSNIKTNFQQRRDGEIRSESFSYAMNIYTGIYTFIQV